MNAIMNTQGNYLKKDQGTGGGSQPNTDISRSIGQTKFNAKEAKVVPPPPATQKQIYTELEDIVRTNKLAKRPESPILARPGTAPKEVRFKNS